MAVISFARGVPAPDCLPVEQIADCARAVVERDGRTILNYGPVGGYEPLREWVAARHGVQASQVLITNGSLQGLYLTQLTDAGRIEIAGNAVIATVALPGLIAIHGALQVIDNPALEALDLSALASIDQALVVTGAPALTLALAPQLQRAAAVQLDAPKLSPELARALRSVAPGP